MEGHVSQLESDQEAVTDLKQNARKLESTSINTLKRTTLMWPILTCSPLPTKNLLNAFRQRWGDPGKWHISSDDDFLRFFAPTVGAAMSIPTPTRLRTIPNGCGKHRWILEVSPRSRTRLQSDWPGICDADRKKRGICRSICRAGDRPQRVVDMLRNLAQTTPESNAIPLPKNADRHPTAYERAMAIAKSFPGQVNLEGFPPPSSPSETVEGAAEPVPVVPSPLARPLRHSAPAP